MKTPACVVMLSVLASACSGGGVPLPGEGSGGTDGSGLASGGASSGGTTGASGGSASGGTSSTGGAQSSGGTTGAGGASSGGASTGGGVGTGGDSSGGSSGTGGGGSTVTESAGCGTAKTLMNGRRTVGSRSYILRVPDNYDSSHPYRLVVAYHWRSGNASQVANGGEGGSTEDPYYGLWDLAKDSTIFVAPEGLVQNGVSGWANSGGADITFTDNILDELLGDLCIDTTRIFATGFSYGAGMSYSIACSRADVFRGVALFAGAQLSGCDGGNTPIAYFHAHGVSDSVLDFEQSGVPLRDHYVGVNGCTKQDPAAPAKNSGTHICTSYAGCSEGHPLRWCAHGGDHNPTEKDQGQAKSWIPGEAWTFISQF